MYFDMFLHLLTHMLSIDKTNEGKFQKLSAKQTLYIHGRLQKFFQGGEKSTFCSFFSGCWRCKANWRMQKWKCPMLRQQLHTVFFL